MFIGAVVRACDAQRELVIVFVISLTTPLISAMIMDIVYTSGALKVTDFAVIGRPITVSTYTDCDPPTFVPPMAKPMERQFAISAGSGV